MGTISGFMADDHDVIDQLWNDFTAATSDPTIALDLFIKFRNHILKHMELEETVLFPMFDNYTGLDKGIGPTTILQRDHAAIKKLIHEVQEACILDKRDEIKKLGSHLDHALKKHTEREKKTQYPVFDNFIRPDEWQNILNRIYHSVN